EEGSAHGGGDNPAGRGIAREPLIESPTHPPKISFWDIGPRKTRKSRNAERNPAIFSVSFVSSVDISILSAVP
ncbi:MAG: hypothetical protein ABI318_20625, partial [Chthoniobacteraceae bacterium]